jgi:hypothetical protein
VGQGYDLIHWAAQVYNKRGLAAQAPLHPPPPPPQMAHPFYQIAFYTAGACFSP